MSLSQFVLAMALVAGIVVLLDFMARHAKDDFHRLGTFIRLGLLLWAYKMSPWVIKVDKSESCRSCGRKSSIHFEGERGVDLSEGEVETIRTLIQLAAPDDPIRLSGPEWKHAHGVCFTPKDMAPGHHSVVIIRQDESAIL